MEQNIPQNTKETVRRLLGRMARQKKKIIVVMLATLLSSAAFTALPLAVGRGIDSLVTAIRTYDGSVGIVGTAVQALWLPVLFVAASALISGLLSYVQQYILASMGEELTLSFRKDISRKLNRLPLRYFDTHKTGEVMSRVTNDLEKVSSVMQEGLPQLISSVCTILFAVVTMLVLSPSLFLVVLISLSVSMAATGYVSKLAQKAYGENLASMGALTGRIEEVYTGNRVVKVFNQQQAMLAEAEKLNQRQFKAQRNAQFADFTIYPVIRALGQLGFIATAVIGGGMALGGSITLGTVQAFLQYVNQIAEPVTETAYVVTSFQAAIAGAERVFELLDEEEESTAGENGMGPISRGHVVFQHVRFGYTPEKTLIKDLNLEVRPNEMVAIVGPTGGGKTTLVNLLMRFYELDGGSISIDGQDIASMPRSGMRRRIGMVLQDTWLFKGTIAENIAYGRRDASREEIAAAARAACCDHFIRTLPYGYDTVLSGDNAGISQGQMQLLTIARAMLTDPAILVLDEATSSVDTRTEMEIQKAMARLMRGKTSFVIAHRLSTIQNADLILVVQDGDIVERGSHRQLMELNGFYASLIRSQFEAA
jgi:ATP-binding cassette subfamily B multidrug efflux pump